MNRKDEALTRLAAIARNFGRGDAVERQLADTLWGIISDLED
jgi:hypothetical protein